MIFYPIGPERSVVALPVEGKELSFVIRDIGSHSDEELRSFYDLSITREDVEAARFLEPRMREVEGFAGMAYCPAAMCVRRSILRTRVFIFENLFEIDGSVYYPVIRDAERLSELMNLFDSEMLGGLYAALTP